MDVQIKTTIKTETKEVEVKETNFILTLTEDEAKELLAITGALSPHSKSSDKGPHVTSDVYHHLSKVFDARGYTYANRRRIKMEGIQPLWVTPDSSCCHGS